MRHFIKDEWYLLVHSVLFGVALGDALGVPVEFMDREELKRSPVTDMRSNGTYLLRAGTWSDDTSLTLCLAESLIQGIDIDNIACLMIKWLKEGYWTAEGDVFDVGITTANAIEKLEMGVSPYLSGATEEWNNGNGGLMRISPLIFRTANLSWQERFQKTSEVCSITHAHAQSIIACFYYTELLLLLLDGIEKVEAYDICSQVIPDQLRTMNVSQKDIQAFDRIWLSKIWEYPESEIISGGYVVNTLEASLWCVFNSSDYATSVLRAVNLGGDSDTTAAVTGALAALIYGLDSVPLNWFELLKRANDISELAKALSESTFRTIE